MGVAEAVRDVTGVGGVLGWGAETLVSAVVGFAVGSFVVGVLALIHRPKTSPHPAGHP
jgi:predicted DNA repair protein MutK